jgi:hypothetical protein
MTDLGEASLFRIRYPVSRAHPDPSSDYTSSSLHTRPPGLSPLVCPWHRDCHSLPSTSLPFRVALMFRSPPYPHTSCPMHLPSLFPDCDGPRQVSRSPSMKSPRVRALRYHSYVLRAHTRSSRDSSSSLLTLHNLERACTSNYHITNLYLMAGLDMYQSHWTPLIDTGSHYAFLLRTVPYT